MFILFLRTRLCDYVDDSKPTSLPPSAKGNTDNPIKLVQAQMTPLLTRPATGDFPATAARAVSSHQPFP